jgi:transposase-like protein
MKAGNRYFRFSKMSEAQFRHLLRCFASDLTATRSAEVTELSVRSVNAIFMRMRKKIAERRDQWSPFGRKLAEDEVQFEPSLLLLRLIREEQGDQAAILKSMEECESFSDFRETRLEKFNGISKRTWLLHQKETEFRFHHRHRNLYKILLSFFRNNPI